MGDAKNGRWASEALGGGKYSGSDTAAASSAATAEVVDGVGGRVDEGLEEGEDVCL